MEFLKLFKKVLSTKQEKEFDSIIDEAFNEVKTKEINYWSLKPKDLSATTRLLNLSDKQKVDFILFAIKSIHQYNDGRTSYSSAEPEYIKSYIQHCYLNHLFKIKVTFDGEDVASIIQAFTSFRRGQWADVTSWPLSTFVIQVGRSFESGGLPQQAKDSLIVLKSTVAKLNRQDKETVKLLDKLDSILFESENGNVKIKPVLLLGDDRFAVYANDVIAQLPEDEKPLWYALISHAQKANGSKPSAKYGEQGRLLVKNIGNDKFKAIANAWFELIAKQKEITKENTYTYGNGRVVTYNSFEFLSGPSMDALKGFIWMCAQFHDARTLNSIASLCERSFKKIPGKGPAAASVGNACLYTLYKSKGLDGIAHLSRLKLRIKQNSTQALIEKYLQEAAKVEGVSVAEIEDLAVDDYGLIEGKREYVVEDYKAVIRIYGIGDVRLEWYKPDGSQQKSVPTVVQTKQKDKLKKIKDTSKQIEVALGAQRDRLDRMFRSNRKMAWEYFVKHYFSHGLLSFLTKNILWIFESNGKAQTCIHVNGLWSTLDSTIYEPEDRNLVSLWHPALASVREIRSWREFLMNNKILQPLKQAYREVYLLTDAEVNTRTYSNRMAAHVLKQHQFNSLAKTRGWKYSLLGAYDDGRFNEGASLKLPDINIQAEFWVNEVNADDAFNETGIWNYVSTDQVRFMNIETNNVIDLVDIPPVVFSEVMRDVDLFVGVASVGNDPNWRDNGGIPAYRDYWQSYSFGELSEIAKTRKEILENLVPRLKIASVAVIRDKFLVVKGKKRTYKIHIGSTNILMEPNDQYLCIVPDRSQKDMTSQVFLPFEGDSGLSVILSKAILLSEDDKITDPTILSQINRK